MKFVNIKSQFIYLLALPLLIVFITICAINISSRFHQETLHWQQHADLIAKQLVFLTKFSFQNNLPQTLSDNASSLLADSDIRSIKVIADGGLMLEAGAPIRAPVVFDPQDNGEKSIQQVFEDFQRLQLQTIIQTQSTSRKIHIFLDISNDRLLLKKYEIVLMNTIGFTFAYCLLLWLILYVNRSMIKPLEQFTNKVDATSPETPNQALHQSGLGEFNLLRQAILNLVARFNSAHQELKDNADQATADLRETLETIEIQNIELDLARKEALKASQIKSEFLANTSHEIRTPLNSILGFTNLILKTPLNHYQKDCSETIKKSSETLLTLINDILDFSKMEAGKLVLDKQVFDLREAIEDVLSMLSPQSNEKGLELIHIIYDDVPTHLFGDILRFKQILMNLINNAIKFTDHGAVTVRAMLEKQANQKALIKINIQDTGIGLSDKQQKVLFGAFAQADSTTSRKYGGTGLGLTICKRLSEMMGGEIGVDSEAYEGSTFWFTVHLEIAAANGPITAEPLKHVKLAFYESHPTQKLSIEHSFHNIGVDAKGYASLEKCLKSIEESYISTQPFTHVALSLPVKSQPPENFEQLVTQLKHQYKLTIILIAHQLQINGLSADTQAMIDIHMYKPVQQKILQEKLLSNLAGDMHSQIQSPPSNTPANILAPHILIVDDHSPNLKLLATLLEHLQLSHDLAHSGDEALQKAKASLEPGSQTYQLILMDIQMPGMDGIAATQAIHQLEGYQELPIVAVTAHALPSEHRHYLKQGLHACMTKPVEEDTLKAMIRKFTGFHPSFHPLAQDNEPSATNHKQPMNTTNKLKQNIIVDLEASTKLAVNKPTLAKELLLMLLDMLEEDFSLIARAFDDQDMQTLLDKTHKLHGATRYCGVPKLRQAAEQLESAIKTTDADNILSLKLPLNTLKQAIDATLQWRIDNESTLNQWRNEIQVTTRS